MTEYTPGPWLYLDTPHPQIVTDAEVAGGSQLKPERGRKIADVRGWGWLQYRDDGESSQDANGRLMAAAPDLYEAAVFLLDHDSQDPDDVLSPESYDAAWDGLKAAVAKAGGRS